MIKLKPTSRFSSQILTHAIQAITLSIHSRADDEEKQNYKSTDHNNHLHVVDHENNNMIDFESCDVYFIQSRLQDGRPVAKKKPTKKLYNSQHFQRWYAVPLVLFCEMVVSLSWPKKVIKDQNLDFT